MDANLLKECINLTTQAVDGPVFIKLIDGELRVGGMSDMNSLVISCKVDSQEKMFFVIPNVFAKQMTRILNAPKVSFVFEGDNVTIMCGRAKMKIACISDSESSEELTLSRYSSKNSVTVSGISLVAAIGKVKHNANDKSLSDPVLLGYHMAIKSDKLELMTTNARALSFTSFPINNTSQEDIVVVLNSKFETVAKLIGAECRLGLSNTNLSVWTKNEHGMEIRVVCALVQGAPKPYEGIFKKVRESASSTANFEKKELQNVIKIMEFFDTKEDKLRVKFTFSEKTLKVETSTAKGSSENFIEYSESPTLKHKDLTIVLHPDIISKAIGSISGDKVVIKFGESNQPIHVSDGTVENVLTVFL